MEPSFLQRSKSISLSPFDDAQFWIIDLNAISEEEARQAELFLDQDALNRSQKVFSEDHRKAILVQAILRFYLGQYLKQSPQEIVVLRGDFGKPYLQNNPLHFNLSHTKRFAFLAFHPCHPIGVDIEEIQNNPDLLKTADFFMQPAEKSRLENSNDPFDYFFTLWCAKEAFVKTLGTGLVDELPLLQHMQKRDQGVDLYSFEDQEIYVYSGGLEGHKLAVSSLSA